MASVGFIGVGKLGQACAEMVAEVHDVVGYDVSLTKISWYPPLPNIATFNLWQCSLYLTTQPIVTV